MITKIENNHTIKLSNGTTIPLNSKEASKLVMPLKEKHLFNNQRVILGDRKGKIASVGSWFVVVKFDNNDDGLFVRKDGKFWYRESKDSNKPTQVAPLYFLKKDKYSEEQLLAMAWGLSAQAIRVLNLSK